MKHAVILAAATTLGTAIAIWIPLAADALARL